MKRKIIFDGEDWVHLSEDLCLIFNERLENFEDFCMQNIELFTRNYLPKTGDIVLDIGSWVGAEIPIFSKMVGESGHVYAIEADPTLYQKNLKLVNLLNLKNVTCINAAIMEKSGTVQIGILSNNRIESSVYANNTNKTIAVMAKSLDDIFIEYGIESVDFVKINIEGAEINALKGISNVSKIKNWCISTHDFCGINTKNFVVNFFNSKKIFVDLHEEVEFKKWEGGYVYVDYQNRL